MLDDVLAHVATDGIGVPDRPAQQVLHAVRAGLLKTHGQKQAITVMNRDAYIKVNPGQEHALEPDTTHVVVDGSSRLAAAREAGLATIKVMVSDDLGSTAEELLESALVANIHRQDLDEIDEARALQRLLAIHGSQRALAKRLHRSQGWVSQRLAQRRAFAVAVAELTGDASSLSGGVDSLLELPHLPQGEARQSPALDAQVRAGPGPQPTSHRGPAAGRCQKEGGEVRTAYLRGSRPPTVGSPSPARSVGEALV
ncbi:ParB/RepB/Spo0J family partition protein [Streptomyces sp. NRRL S-1022]|uniref:ParB/RepB/Spo0J family partition protein n=1 Tax=Streptomyces sp. NRRL S-1022 TaxID=1463880 RepID=UPI001F3F0214|nr:hypothetical protein [Streptomyces sp. NRRL S-1022]